MIKIHFNTGVSLDVQKEAPVGYVSQVIQAIQGVPKGLIQPHTKQILQTKSVVKATKKRNWSRRPMLVKRCLNPLCPVKLYETKNPHQKYHSRSCAQQHLIRSGKHSCFMGYRRRGYFTNKEQKQLF